jgi:hypothetical protein
MKKIATLAALSLIGLGAAAVSSTSASAAIVCSGDDCWHAREAYSYPAEAHVIVHGDDWKWGEHDHFRWREHEGRGYWRGDRWTDF